MQTASVKWGHWYLGCVLAVAGCDAQVAVHYPGESLLTIRGNVPPLDWVFTRVSEPEEERIAARLDADSLPFNWK